MLDFDRSNHAINWLSACNPFAPKKSVNVRCFDKGGMGYWKKYEVIESFFFDKNSLFVEGV